MIQHILDNWRGLKYRWHRWYYYGGEGRHVLDTAQMAAIETDLDGREWLSQTAAPALPTLDPGPELPPDDGYTWNPALAILLAENPRLGLPDDEYWGIRYVDFYGRLAWDTAQANKLRAECGLPPRPIPARMTAIYTRGIAA